MGPMRLPHACVCPPWASTVSHTCACTCLARNIAQACGLAMHVHFLIPSKRPGDQAGNACAHHRLAFEVSHGNLPCMWFFRTSRPQGQARLAVRVAHGHARMRQQRIIGGHVLLHGCAAGQRRRAARQYACHPLGLHKEQGHKQKRLTTRSWGCWEECMRGWQHVRAHTHDSGRTVAGLSLNFCAWMGACGEADGAAADNTGARCDAPAAQTACCAAT